MLIGNITEAKNFAIVWVPLWPLVLRELKGLISTIKNLQRKRIRRATKRPNPEMIEINK